MKRPRLRNSGPIRLNAKGVLPPQGKEWTKSLVYNLRLRLSHITPRPHNTRNHDDNQVRERILELRARGHTARQIASILNEQGWIPLKGRGFTERSVQGLLRTSDAAKILSPSTAESSTYRVRYVECWRTPAEGICGAEGVVI